MSTLADFQHLFRGRRDVWGKVHGEAVKGEPLTDQHWVDHLYGGGSLGIYPIVPVPLVEHPGVPDGALAVAWGCTDIDMAEDPEASLPLAVNMHRALSAMDVTAWIERTKGKGFHVWVFVHGWVPANTMRECLLAAHQVAGVAPSEVNPKQVSTDHLKVGLGNYVNLPYAHTWAVLGKRVVLSTEPEVPWLEPMGLDHWVRYATATMNEAPEIEAAAKLYVPPPPRRAVDIEQCSDEKLASLVERMPGLPFTIFQQGPFFEGATRHPDRSQTLAHMAHLLAEAHDHDGVRLFMPGEALALLVDADKRWGKFWDRADGQYQLEKMIVAAYG